MDEVERGRAREMVDAMDTSDDLIEVREKRSRANAPHSAIVSEKGGAKDRAQ